MKPILAIITPRKIDDANEIYRLNTRIKIEKEDNEGNLIVGCRDRMESEDAFVGVVVLGLKALQDLYGPSIVHSRSRLYE